MKIRNKLSLQFTLIFAVLLFLVLAGIFISAERNRKRVYFDRLLERARTIGDKMLAEDNLTPEEFEHATRSYHLLLNLEVAAIYDDKFQTIYLKPGPLYWQPSTLARLRTLKQIEYSVKETDVAGLYYLDNSGNYFVMVSANDIYGHQKIRQLFWAMVLAFFAAVFIMFFLGRIFARIALSPITRVIDEVKIIRATSLDMRLDVTKNKDEINELAVTFNNLLEHLQQSFDTQKSFVANASHELRTPLTSMIGAIEVAMLSARTDVEYRETLNRVLTETERLNELINSLFDLATTNIDVQDFEEIRLDELIWQVKDEWANRIPGSKLELVYNLPSDANKYTIQGNRYLLYTALGNIVKNAIKFSQQELVTCSLYCDQNRAIISIRDRGIGIPEAEVAKIFQPFYRGANAKNYAGLGIGLSLVEKIFRLHDITIEINSKHGSGTEFLISFPSGATRDLNR